MIKRYIATVLTLLLLRMTDLFLTWIYTPDLTAEYNPVVSVLGSSWQGLITVQLVFLLAVALFGTFAFFSEPPKVTMKGLNMPDFIYCYFFHELRPWPQRFFTRPSDHRPHLIFNGFMFISVALLISIFAILNNALLILRVNWYETFLANHYVSYFPTVFISIVTLSFFLFFGKSYSNYKVQTGEQGLS